MKQTIHLKIAIIPIMGILLLALVSCDPEHCRDCDTFNFDITNWSAMDDTISQELKFIDENFNEILFELVEVELSEPYTECQLAGSVESVSCRMSKKIRYRSNNYEFDIVKTYNQIEVPGGNPAVNNCAYLIELENENNHILTQVHDLVHDIETLNILIPRELYTLANEEYTNVHVLEIDKMIVFNTYQTIDVELVDPEILEIVIQIPNGIIGLTLKNGTKLILSKE